MERVEISPDLSLSRLVYGMWRVADDSDRSPAHVQAKIEACLVQGITTLDQADIYGDYEAEAVLGDALQDNPSLRDAIEIVTKCGILVKSGKYPNRRLKHYDTSSAHISSSVEQSLKNMCTDHIDLLLIHRPDPFMDAAETGAALDGLVSAGKVRAVGVSNFTVADWSLLQSTMQTTLAVNQIEISPLHPTPFLDGSLSWMQQNGVKAMAWSPLGGGRLFKDEGAELREVLERIGTKHNVDISAVAVAWLLAHPAGILPVLGTNNLDRIGSLSDATKVKLDRETWFEILSVGMGKEVP